MRPAEYEAIRAGTIDLAFRRWDRPRVRVGTQMRTPIGLVEITEVEPTTADVIGEDEARRAGANSRAELVRRLDLKHSERAIYRIGMHYAGPDPRVALRELDDLSDEEHAQLAAHLRRLDRARTEPWTGTTLAIIERSPATRAPDLAAELGRETAAFKRDVRKLKELGLTESLEKGYRLSPRGAAVLRWLRRPT